jgi:hydrogenase-4 component F
MISAFFIIPFIGGLVSLLLPNDSMRRILLLVTAGFHTGFTIYSWFRKPEPFFYDWLLLDNLGLLFLSITSIIFLAVAFYCVGYLANEKEKQKHKDFEENIFFTNASEAVFTGCLLIFLGTMSLITISNNFGLTWVAVEASTLASAPLIYFHRHHRSLEATWKYLMICSVGIALSLLGNFLLAVSLPTNQDEIISLNLTQVLANTGNLKLIYLKTAFIFFLVGYGTKMGLAPMHTWLPDAHSEAPSVVSALLSGALLNCSFLGILRAYQVCNAAGLADFCNELLILLGLLSMAVATIFILGQVDFKRMLAYSSIEHMGIMALGVGLGGVATFGSFIHSVNHSFTKAMLFMISGNILSAYHTKNISEVKGVIKELPVSGVLWMAGFLSITGFPPFGTFLSEFTILKGALERGYFAVAIIYLILIAIIFIGMAISILGMSHGNVPLKITDNLAVLTKTGQLSIAKTGQLEILKENFKLVSTWLRVIPPAILGIIVLFLGFYLPSGFTVFLQSIARTLGAP